MLKKIVIYIVIGVVLTTAPLYYMNNVLFSDAKAQIEANDRGLSKQEKIQLKVPDGAKYISLLYNKSYVSYVNSGMLYINDTSLKDSLRTVVDESDIIYAVPMVDRNIVIYFTYKDNKLSVKTYDLDRDDKTDHKDITIKNFVRLKDVKYSSLTNVIYIDAEVLEGKTYKDKIYRVDIMKDVTLYEVDNGISGIVLLNSKDTLAYQNASNNVYIKGKLFKYQDYKKFRLLGADKDDRIYMSPMDDLSRVFEIKDGKVEKTIYIDDTSYIRYLNRDNSIYLIYNDHILNLVDNKVIKIDPGSRVVDISESSILYESGVDEIVVERMKL